MISAACWRIASTPPPPGVESDGSSGPASCTGVGEDDGSIDIGFSFVSPFRLMRRLPFASFPSAILFVVSAPDVPNLTSITAARARLRRLSFLC